MNKATEISAEPRTVRRKSHLLDNAMVFIKSRPVSSGWQLSPVSCCSFGTVIIRDVCGEYIKMTFYSNQEDSMR